MILDARGHEVNGNGASLTEHQRKKLLAQNATVGEVHQIAADYAYQHAVQATNHLGNQVGPAIHKIVSEAIQGYHAALTEMLKAKGIELDFSVLGSPTGAQGEQRADAGAGDGAGSAGDCEAGGRASGSEWDGSERVAIRDPFEPGSRVAAAIPEGSEAPETVAPQDLPQEPA